MFHGTRQGVEWVKKEGPKSRLREVDMSGLMAMLIVWSVITGILVCLIIYRSILGNREEDQLFLDQAEAALEQANEAVVKQINRIDPIIRWIAIASGALLLVMGCIWFYRGWYSTAGLE
jgi:hypothetical protein